MSELEGGSFFKTLSEDIDKRAGYTAPSETAPMSMPEIRNKYSKELSAYIDSHPDPTTKDLAKRWFEGKLSGDDLTKGLPGLQREFLEHQKNVEGMSTVMAKEALSGMKQRSPEFAALCDTYGDAVMSQVLEKGIYNKGFTDRKLYGDMHAHWRRIEMVKKEMMDGQKGIDDFCKRFNIKEDEFRCAMNGVNSQDRQHMLRQYIKANTSFSYRLQTHWRREANETGNMKDAFEKLIGRRNDVLGDAGVFIEGLIKSGPDWQEAMNRAVNEELPHFKEEVSTIMTFDEARAMLNPDKQAEDARSFKKEWLKKSGEKDWKDAADARAAQNEFFAEQREKIKNNRGRWKDILAALFNSRALRGDPGIKSVFATS